MPWKQFSGILLPPTLSKIEHFTWVRPFYYSFDHISYEAYLEGTSENILFISHIVLLQYSSKEATIKTFCYDLGTLSKAPQSWFYLSFWHKWHFCLQWGLEIALFMLSITIHPQNYVFCKVKTKILSFWICLLGYSPLFSLNLHVNMPFQGFF